MQVLELMKTHVTLTTPDATLREAVDLMDLYQVNGLPVVDGDGRLCGLISEADVQCALFPDARAGEIPDKVSGQERAETPVRAIMTAPAHFAGEHDDAREAAQRMLRAGLKRLPVVSETGQVIGVLNRIDLFQALLDGDLTPQL